jgi:hypothetical protein
MLVISNDGTQTKLEKCIKKALQPGISDTISWAKQKLQGHLEYLARTIAFQMAIMQGNRGDHLGWLKNMIANL